MMTEHTIKNLNSASIGAGGDKKDNEDHSASFDLMPKDSKQRRKYQSFISSSSCDSFSDSLDKPLIPKMASDDGKYTTESSGLNTPRLFPSYRLFVSLMTSVAMFLGYALLTDFSVAIVKMAYQEPSALAATSSCVSFEVSTSLNDSSSSKSLFIASSFPLWLGTLKISVKTLQDDLEIFMVTS